MINGEMPRRPYNDAEGGVPGERHILYVTCPPPLPHNNYLRANALQ